MSITSRAITTPEEMHGIFGKVANLGDTQSLLSLCEAGATIAPPPGSPLSAWRASGNEIPMRNVRRVASASTPPHHEVAR